MAMPQTDLEQSGTWTTLAHETAFLAAVQAESGGRMEYEEFSYSNEGDPIYLVRLGYPAAPSYDDLAHTNPIFVVGSQHGDEPAGREAALAWLRDMAETMDAAALDVLTNRGIVVIPTGNPLGFRLGTRDNGTGDPNRTHLALFSSTHPESRAIQTVVRDARPCVAIDLHESGTSPTAGWVQLLPPSFYAPNALPDAATLAEAYHDAVGAAIVGHGETWSEYGGTGDTRKTMQGACMVRGVIHMMAETPSGSYTDRVAAHTFVCNATVDWVQANDATISTFCASRYDDAITKGATQGSFDINALVDPAPVGYRISASQFNSLASQRDILGIGAYLIDDGSGDYYVPLSQPQEPLIPWVVDEDSVDAVLSATRIYTVPATTDVAYRLDRSTDAGGTYEWVQDWTAGDLSESLDLTTLPKGNVTLRVQARDAANPLDVSGYGTVTVSNSEVEYEADYRIDGGAWTPLQAWAGDRSEALDTDAIGAWSTLDVRVRARDAANNGDVSAYDTVSYTATAAVTLTVQDAAHGHTAGSPTLSQAHALAVADASHGHTADTPTLAVAGSLAVQSATHGHTAEAPSLVQAHTLTVADAVHGHSADSPVLSFGAILTVSDALHAHTAGTPTLTLADVLAVADALHSHTAESPSLVQANVLAVADALHGHTADTVVLGGFVEITGPLTATLTDSRRTITLADSRLTITLG